MSAGSCAQVEQIRKESTKQIGQIKTFHETIRSVTRKAIFLDRDGTINVKPAPGQYVRRADQLVLLRGAANAIRIINRSGALAVVVSNQRWLSTTEGSRAAFHPLRKRLDELLIATGAHLDGCYICPHPLESCGCRKPTPGMLLEAAADLDIDLKRSVAIGDSPVDIAAARTAGARCALLADNRREAAGSPTADRVFCTLREAVEWAL